MICEVLENTHYILRCLFFGLDKLSSLSLSLIIMCFWPSVILVALLWTKCHMSKSTLQWETKLGHSRPESLMFWNTSEKTPFSASWQH